MANLTEHLEHSIIVITGASSGFGRGAALALAQKGANVVLAARRADLLDELVGEIQADGGNALAVPTDVTVLEEVENLAQRTLDTYGRIDVWVNNAGVGALGNFWEIPPDVHARVVDVNLKSLIYGTHVAITQFLKQEGGTLVNVGSVDSEVPLALQNTYAASKAGVLSLGRSVNEELRLSGHGDTIRIATVLPWAVDTPWWDHAANYTGHTARMAAMDDPEPVVQAIVKACTDPEERIPVGVKAHASTLSHHIAPGLTGHQSGKTARRESGKGDRIPDTNGALFTPMEQGRTVDGGIRTRMKREDNE